MLKLFKFSKDFLLIFPVTFIFKPFSKFFLFIIYFNKLIKWIFTNKKNFIYNDFYLPFRESKKRYEVYEFLSDHFLLLNKEIIYIEFGVFKGSTFSWWLKNNENKNSRFYGFDTFNGLPESWGGYSKGDMLANIPKITDNRGEFFKGLFQDTLCPFIEDKKNELKSENVKIIHLDSDLYSSAIFVLSQLYQYLREGDIIIFDEFNVALHEFKAFLEFTSSFYVKLKPIIAVNNFYQVAFVVQLT